MGFRVSSVSLLCFLEIRLVVQDPKKKNYISEAGRRAQIGFRV